MTKIPVQSPSRNYVVHCGRGAVRNLSRLLNEAGESSSVFLLTSPTVWRACKASFEPALRNGDSQRQILFNDRESAKRLVTVEKICHALARAGADRDSLLVAIGGGVVGDVAGFAAASYLRGVRLVHVPTTLVAQVDSAIGGKTGVNLLEGKNLVGAFYQPSLVVADPDLLRTLSERQFRSGIYEVIKYGIIGDAELFDFLENNLNKILKRDPEALGWIVPRCILAKAEVVRRDEREGGLRQILNYGHTMGHALEAATSYRRYLHGEAIAWGTVYATMLSLATDRIDELQAGKIIRLVARVGAVPGLQGLHFARLLELARGDKKARAGKIRWVLAGGIGRVEWGIEVPDAVLREAYNELASVMADARRS